MSGKNLTDNLNTYNIQDDRPFRPKILRLARKLTSRMTEPVRVGDPEYYGYYSTVTDEMADVALRLKQRRLYTFEEIQKRNPKVPPEKLRELVDKLAYVGVLEYYSEFPDGVRRYMMPLIVVGSGEWSNMNLKRVEEHPELARFFERMTILPLKGLTQMVPPGGAGIGMHVIPVEQAIPNRQEAKDVEFLSHWLAHSERFAAIPCTCRVSRQTLGESVGDDVNWCISCGGLADYVVETGKCARYISREEAAEILKKAEENGFVHQITNIDGEENVIAICNCDVNTCNALRLSQLFNTPNLNRSAYVARVDKDNCVACGRCVEYCPAGAVKLGQKLCTKEGPIEYPKTQLPDDVRWSAARYDFDYRDNNRKNCYDTGTAPCKTACPAHIPVQGYLKMAAQGRYTEALALIKKYNPLPAVCGAVCNRRCEDACTRGLLGDPVAIDEVKKFLAKRDMDAETRYIPPVIKKKVEGFFEEKIAIIGAGPSGLSCAYYLAQMGHNRVTVFDKNAAPGGMLMTGIPSFRLEKDVLNAEIDVIRALGVEFRCGVEVGKDISLQQLRDEGYRAFYLAIGAQKSARLGLPGEDLKGVFGGVDFLRAVNSGDTPSLGKRVAVIGGGNVAMDICRTAVRLGAEVTVVYRRSEAEMPADSQELAQAKAEGVRFAFLSAPVEILGTESGGVRALRVEKMELGAPGERTKAAPVGTGVFEEIEADSVIAAIGQSIDWGQLDVGALEIGRKGAALADSLTLQTAQPDIFVGGDVYTGPKFAIDAIAAGKVAATSLHRYVRPNTDLSIGRNRRDFIELNKENLALSTDSFDCPDRAEVRLDAGKAKTFHDDRLPFTEEQVRAETSRCLGCGASVVDENKCIGCGICTTKCEFDAIHIYRERPECSTMVPAEKMIPSIAKYAVKRAGKIALRDVKNLVENKR